MYHYQYVLQMSLELHCMFFKIIIMMFSNMFVKNISVIFFCVKKDETMNEDLCDVVLTPIVTMATHPDSTLALVELKLLI